MVANHRARAQRRALLKGLLAAPFAFGLARPGAAATEERALSFYHLHTAERLRVVYFAGGDYVPQSLERIDWLLRDFRTGGVRPIDRRLLDILYAVCAACGGGAFQVISGYRSPETNEWLRSRGAGGVARASLHMDGRAIDVRLAGARTAQLRAAAVALARGGVGYYPESDFVHLDTGHVRTWGPLAG